MRFKCHNCETEFDEKYAVYYETPGSPKCPLCNSSVGAIYIDGWRDVREELPDIGVSVQVYCHSGQQDVMFRCELKSPRGKIRIRWTDGNIFYDGVTYWQPLPSPPKEGE